MTRMRNTCWAYLMFSECRPLCCHQITEYLLHSESVYKDVLPAANIEHTEPTHTPRLNNTTTSVFEGSTSVLLLLSRSEHQWTETSLQEAWTLRELPRLRMAGKHMWRLARHQSITRLHSVIASLNQRIHLFLSVILGLDYCSRGLCSLLLWWRMFISTQCTYECHKPCDCADLGKPPVLHHRVFVGNKKYSSSSKNET